MLLILRRVLQNYPKKLSKSLNFPKLRLLYIHKVL